MLQHREQKVELGETQARMEVCAGYVYTRAPARGLAR